jgi:TPP-dependent 2-oxoacid decarboxylase
MVPSITISEYVLHRLAEIGLKDIFGVPGDFNLSELPRRQRF